MPAKKRLEITTRILETAAFNTPESGNAESVIYGTEEELQVAAPVFFEGETADDAEFNGLIVEYYEPIEAENSIQFLTFPEAEPCEADAVPESVVIQ